MNVGMVIMGFVLAAATGRSAPAHAATVDTPCPGTGTNPVWSSACFESTAAGRQIKKNYLSNLGRQRAAHTVIIIAAPPELVVVNRHGKVVRTTKARLAGFSFEPGDRRGEPLRFSYPITTPAGETRYKCGYYREPRFRILVPPLYDECDSFNEETALVCIGCIDVCDDGDCHERDFIHGEAFVINQQHEVLRKFTLPELPLCAEGHPPANSSAQCRARPPNPFSELK